MKYQKYIFPPKTLWEVIFGSSRWCIFAFDDGLIEYVLGSDGYSKMIIGGISESQFKKSLPGRWIELSDEEKAELL